MIKLLYKSSVSACFELEGEGIYNAPKSFSAYLNGEKQGVFDTNVFSFFSLKPNTSYTLTTDLDEKSVVFCTNTESAVIDVRDFGAAGDGVADDTVSVQTAVNVCPLNGRIVFSRGVYSVAPLTLKSGITLEICDGAVIKATADKNKFPLIKATARLSDGETPKGVADFSAAGESGKLAGRSGAAGENKCGCNLGAGKALQIDNDGLTELAVWEGEPFDCYQSVLSLHYLRDVHVVGKGLIDGSGGSGGWWVNPKEQKVGRPRLMFANRCENINFHGVRCSDSPSWNYHPYFCRKVGFYDIEVTADKNSPNTDGINPESCDGVDIIGVRFSVGDDCIAIKSGKMRMGFKYKTPSSRITVRNCLMRHGHGAVVLGSEMSGGVRDLSVSKCLFQNTDRGLRIKTRRGRGKYGVIDGVEFSHIIMENVAAPLVINMFYFCDPDGKTEYVWSKEKLPVDDGTPALGSFIFRDIVCTGVEQACGFFYGLPEKPIGSILLRNVRFTVKSDARAGLPAMMSFLEPCKKKGIIAVNVDKLVTENVEFIGTEE